ncbi:MAG: hypothetical protein KGJ07_05245 [Patescibacteria group bacterium]|nr:hypothetical protein [Patescibacteria group bacterium]
MRKENSEVAEILFATDFEKAYFVDPVYGVKGKDCPLSWDLRKMHMIDSHSLVKQTESGVTVMFTYQKKQREIIFVAGDATLPQFQPQDFTIFFSGRRIGLYPGFGLRATPIEYLPEIVKRLPLGGFVVPDRALLDDSVYFVLPPKELGLEEVTDIRVSVSRAEFPKGHEDTLFIHKDEAQGVGLYKKVTEV